MEGQTWVHMRPYDINPYESAIVHPSRTKLSWPTNGSLIASHASALTKMMIVSGGISLSPIPLQFQANAPR